MALGAHGHGPLGGSRFQSVLQEIQDDLLELVRIREEPRQVGIIGPVQKDGALADFSGVQVAKRVSELVEIGRSQLETRLPPEEEKVAHQDIQALSLKEH